jgi:hypothetical protein
MNSQLSLAELSLYELRKTICNDTGYQTYPKLDRHVPSPDPVRPSSWAQSSDRDSPFSCHMQSHPPCPATKTRAMYLHCHDYYLCCCVTPPPLTGQYPISKEEDSQRVRETRGRKCEERIHSTCCLVLFKKCCSYPWYVCTVVKR